MNLDTQYTQFTGAEKWRDGAIDVYLNIENCPIAFNKMEELITTTLNLYNFYFWGNTNFTYAGTTNDTQVQDAVIIYFEYQELGPGQTYANMAVANPKLWTQNNYFWGGGKIKFYVPQDHLNNVGNIQKVLNHEFGHVAGVVHNNDPSTPDLMDTYQVLDHETGLGFTISDLAYITKITKGYNDGDVVEGIEVAVNPHIIKLADTNKHFLYIPYVLFNSTPYCMVLWRDPSHTFQGKPYFKTGFYRKVEKMPFEDHLLYIFHGAGTVNSADNTMHLTDIYRPKKDKLFDNASLQLHEGGWLLLN